MITVVSMVWGDYGRFIPEWLENFATLEQRAKGIIVHGPTIEPSDFDGWEQVKWLPADPFDTIHNGPKLLDQGVRAVESGWVWATAIDDFVTPAGITRLLEAPSNAEFMLMSVVHTDGSDRWDSNFDTILGHVSSYRMAGGCPFTVDLYKRAGSYSNPPGKEIAHEWGWYLRVMAARPVVFDGCGPIAQLNTKNLTGFGRTQLDVGVQNDVCHQYARELGLI